MHLERWAEAEIWRWGEHPGQGFLWTRDWGGGEWGSDPFPWAQAAQSNMKTSQVSEEQGWSWKCILGQHRSLWWGLFQEDASLCGEVAGGSASKWCCTGHGKGGCLCSFRFCMHILMCLLWILRGRVPKFIDHKTSFSQLLVFGGP